MKQCDKFPAFYCLSKNHNYICYVAIFRVVKVIPVHFVKSYQHFLKRITSFNFCYIFFSYLCILWGDKVLIEISIRCILLWYITVFFSNHFYSVWLKICSIFPLSFIMKSNDYQRFYKRIIFCYIISMFLKITFKYKNAENIIIYLS